MGRGCTGHWLDPAESRGAGVPGVGCGDEAAWADRAACTFWRPAQARGQHAQGQDRRICVYITR